MKVVVVIPTFNEKDNIPRLISKIRKVLPCEILVVDDNSPDGTQAVVLKITKRRKEVRLLPRSRKTGLGAAYLDGLSMAFGKLAADVAVVMDADLSHNPSYLPHFLKAIEDGNDFVLGSRYIKGGAIPKAWAPHRRFLSIFGNKMVSAVLGRDEVTDWTSGYRAMRKKVFAAIRPQLSQMRGYTFNTSFVYHTLVSGFKVTEIPIKFLDRRSGKSKLGFEYLFHLPLFIFKTRLKL